MKRKCYPKTQYCRRNGVGIPGAVAGILEVHKKMGTLPLEQLMQPAIDLAENGLWSPKTSP